MFFIYFFPKVLMITTVLIIILTLVSTENLYQMVKNEDHDYFIYRDASMENYERKMVAISFYDTIYNLNHRRVPGPCEKLNHEDYKNKLKNFCNSEYLTWKYYGRMVLIRKFENEIFTLKSCLNNILKTKNNGEIQRNLKLKTDMIQALQWISREGDENFNIELRLNAKQMKDCLVTNPNFVSCLDYTYEENKQAKNYARKLLSNIQNLLSYPNNEFVSCIKLFKKDLAAAFYGNTWIIRYLQSGIYIRDLYLALSLIYHIDSELDNINMSDLFTNYMRLLKVNVTMTERSDCYEKIDTMDLASYTKTMLYYSIIPKLSEIDSYNNYVSNRREIIAELGTQYPEYYDEIKKSFDSITQEKFKDMIKRRPMEGEDDYILYIMRMNIRGYFPLPYNLWKNEKAKCHMKDIQEFIEKELAKDLIDLNVTMKSNIVPET